VTRSTSVPGRRNAAAAVRATVLLAVLFAVLLAARPAGATTFRLFGSAGVESQLTPANEGSPLNPGNVADIPYRTNVSDLTVFADAVGADRRWKLHLKVRGATSDRAADRIDAGELYLEIAPKRWLEITVGRVIEKWGTGYAWNPTAFVSPPKNPTDPNDRVSASRGVTMARADLFLGKTNVSLYALPHQAFAARVYRLVAGTDVSVNMRRDPEALRGGMSASRVFGPALELHAEAAWSRVALGGSFGSALVGGQYTFPRGVNVIAELQHGGDGLSAAQWRTFTELTERDLRAANQQFVPLHMARNYSFVRLDVPFQGGKSDAELLSITSLRDQSTILRLTLTHKLTATVSAYLIESEFCGSRGSELSSIQIRRSTAAGFRVSF
jgi:hypothetical protein